LDYIYEIFYPKLLFVGGLTFLYATLYANINSITHEAEIYIEKKVKKAL